MLQNTSRYILIYRMSAIIQTFANQNTRSDEPNVNLITVSSSDFESSDSGFQNCIENRV
jgi:hypothetical protein